jgi:hypothetical protein
MEYVGASTEKNDGTRKKNILLHKCESRDFTKLVDLLNKRRWNEQTNEHQKNGWKSLQKIDTTKA